MVINQSPRSLVYWYYVHLAEKFLINIFYVDTDAGKHFEVKCEDIASFPNLVMSLGEKTLTLEPSYYTMKYMDHCYSRLKPINKAYWQMGDAFLSKFYTEYDLTKDHQKVNFFVAK